jgi:hypothetical protein
MLTSAECRANAEAKLAEAEQDERHRRRLITAAEGWLFLAGEMKRAEAMFAVHEFDANKRLRRSSRGRPGPRARVRSDHIAGKQR